MSFFLLNMGTFWYSVLPSSVYIICLYMTRLLSPSLSGWAIDKYCAHYEVGYAAFRTRFFARSTTSPACGCDQPCSDPLDNLVDLLAVEEAFAANDVLDALPFLVPGVSELGSRLVTLGLCDVHGGDRPISLLEEFLELYHALFLFFKLKFENCFFYISWKFFPIWFIFLTSLLLMSRKDHTKLILSVDFVFCFHRRYGRKSHPMIYHAFRILADEMNIATTFFIRHTILLVRLFNIACFALSRFFIFVVVVVTLEHEIYASFFEFDRDIGSIE